MTVHLFMMREPFLKSSGSRFFLLFAFLMSYELTFGQSDSLLRVAISAENHYFDVFRQKSERSNTIVLAKRQSANVTLSHGQHLLSLEFARHTNYASIDQRTSVFSVSLKDHLDEIIALWRSTFLFVNYSVSLQIPIKAVASLPGYEFSVGLHPFGEVLTGLISFRKNPFLYSNGIFFQDFYVPLHERVDANSFSYSLHSEPLPDFHGTVNFYEMRGDRTGYSLPYATSQRVRSFGKEVLLRYGESRYFQVAIATKEHRFEMTFQKEGQSFGDFTNGSGKHSHYEGKGGFELWSAPLSAIYSFDRISAEGIGEFESWPFTMLASSIITNRLYYRLSGRIDLHKLSFESSFQLSPAQLAASASYVRAHSDMYAEHWEPQFLVFGVKNFARDPFSIESLHLARIGLRISFGLMEADVMLSAGQYVPLAVQYRSAPALPAPSPGAPPSPRPLVDGGREFGMSVSLAL